MHHFHAGYCLQAYRWFFFIYHKLLNCCRSSLGPCLQFDTPGWKCLRTSFSGRMLGLSKLKISMTFGKAGNKSRDFNFLSLSTASARFLVLLFPASANVMFLSQQCPQFVPLFCSYLGKNDCGEQCPFLFLILRRLALLSCVLSFTLYQSRHEWRR